MSAEPPPSGGNSGFNPDDWTNANDPIDNQFLAANYLQFPLAQGTETLANTTVSGVLTVQNNSTFADLATFNNGIDITTTAGIKFSDTTVQTTAFIEANYAQLNTDNTFLPTFTNTFNGSVDLGTNAIATTQASGNNSTLVATTAFVQDAVQVSGVQVGDSPLLWQGANTWQYNAGTPSTLTYSFPYGISNAWNITGGQGDSNIIANGGGNGGWDNAFRIYCVQNNTSNSTLATTTPQLQLSNNGTSMQVKDGINIPLGQTYSINNVNILNPYSTTLQMNSAISTALTPYALINGQQFTGAPTLQTTPTAGISSPSAIANLQYITNQGFAPLASPALTGTPTAPTQALGTNNTSIATTEFVLANSDPAPDLTNYAQLNTATEQTFTGTVNFTGSTTAPTQSVGDNSPAIATTAFVNSVVNGISNVFTVVAINNDIGAPPSLPTGTDFTFTQTYLAGQNQNNFVLQSFLVNLNNANRYNFNLVFPQPLYPTGATASFGAGSGFNITNNNGFSFNLQINLLSQNEINFSSGGTGNSTTVATISGQIYIVW